MRKDLGMGFVAGTCVCISIEVLILAGQVVTSGWVCEQDPFYPTIPLEGRLTFRKGYENVLERF